MPAAGTLYSIEQFNMFETEFSECMQAGGLEDPEASSMSGSSPMANPASAELRGNARA